MDSRLILPAKTLLDGSYRILRVVGSGGFGITYAAEDMSLRTTVAIKEYYPIEFGDRDATMSVRPKSERHKQTFDWGRTNFVQEARTLARFEHPSIVRVLRVFEAHSTAYMVMRFEEGRSFEAWLKALKRPPTQEELDRIIGPLLDALELMHSGEFLHRDIAPDNIIIRADGTPVLLDFGAARRAMAQMSRALTGIVKAGYSPHEQYSSDGRLQGPWSDIYALGGTLYRAVVGKPPEEATLRIDQDQMATAAQAAKGEYRQSFLAAIDACLKVRHAERPRSVAQLRPMLLGQGSQPAPSRRVAAERTALIDQAPPAPVVAAATGGEVARRWPIVAAILAVMLGAGGGIVYTSLQGIEQRRQEEERAAADRKAATERMAAAERMRQEEARQAEEARLAAEKKTTDAQRSAQADFQEGERYVYGRGGATIDYARAREAFERAANADHAGAMVGLGWLYQTGRGVPRDYAKARDLYEKAAAKGNSAGMANLGWLYRDGLGVPRDYARARDWYEKAAAAGNSAAMLNVGWLHQNGWGVSRDYAKAREWYEKAAAKGNSAGMANIGNLYRNGLGVPRDYAKARDWYEKAAAAGNSGAMISLGWLHQAGQGMPQDYAKARDWYEKAAAANNPIGMSNVAWLYRDGLGVPRDYAKAREWFEKAVAAGSGAGMNGLGALYQNGEGVPKDYAKAREWYEKGAATGEDFSMHNLGRLYQNGWGVTVDMPKAREWYEKSATAGNRFAKRDLALMLDQGVGGIADHGRAAKLLLEAAKIANTAAVEELRGPMAKWSRPTRIEIKRELSRLGHYSGPINDDWDNPARTAVNQYLTSG